MSDPDIKPPKEIVVTIHWVEDEDGRLVVSKEDTRQEFEDELAEVADEFGGC
jgi:hypothetical protein